MKTGNTLFWICLTMTIAFNFMASSGAAQEASPWTANSKEIRFVDEPGEIVAKLSNGMIAVIKENHTAPVAAVRLHVRAGSIYEGEHLGAGLSHLFEHLLAGGTTQDLTEEQSMKIIQETGAKFNASTSKARTQYYLTVPSRHVGTALSTIASWVTRPAFPEEEFSREWGVVQRELEMGTTDVNREQWKLQDEMRYLVHPAKFPVIGHQEILQALTRKQIMDYYDTMYIPDNCVVAVVGDIDAEKMLEEVKKEFSSFKRKFVPTIVLPTEPEVTAPRTMVKILPFMNGPARLTVGFPSFKLQDPDLYSLDTLAGILGSGQSSRLYKRLHEEKQLVLDVNSYNFTPDYAAGTFYISCVVEQDKIDQTIAEIWDVINEIKSEGVSDKELSRTKKQMQVAHIRSHQTAEDIASTMADDYLSTGDPHFSEHYCENMQKVTKADVKAMAQKYFDPQKQLTLILSGTPLPKKQEKTESSNKQSAIKKVVLENGLRVLIKRDPTTELVNMRFMTLGGLLDENDANSGITNIATQMAIKGTEHYDNNQITDFFENVGGYITPECSNNTFGYSSEVMKDDFTAAFDIFTEVIQKPTCPNDQFDKLKPVLLSNIEQIANSWQAEAARHFRASFFNKNPYKRASYGTKESLANLTAEQVREYLKNTQSAKRSVLVVFGDIDVKKVESLVIDKFKGMPAGTDIDFERYGLDENNTRRLLTKKTEKEGATVTIGMPGMRVYDTTDSYPLAVLNQMIGSNTGWLHNTLRGKSLVYYAFCFDMKGLVPGYVTATAQCESDKAPEVLSLMEQLLNKAAKGEFTDDDVNAAKSNLVNSEVFKTLTLSDTAKNAALNELYYSDFNYSSGNADRYMAVTTDAVKNIAMKYLGQPRTITINSSKPELFKK